MVFHMKRAIINQLTKSFEEAVHVEQNIEYWMARDIQELLEYNEWRNFLNVIDKAKIACEKSRQPIENHFVDVNKMVKLGSGSDRELLTSCYQGMRVILSLKMEIQGKKP